MTDSLDLWLRINLTYKLNGEDYNTIIRLLERLPRTIADVGGFTGDGPAKVDNYSSYVRHGQDKLNRTGLSALACEVLRHQRLLGELMLRYEQGKDND